MNKGLSKKIICLVALITTTTSTMAFAQDINKDETVYVLLDEKGNPTEQIVSDWISSDKALGSFNDKSNLENIKNVKGDEEPVLSGDTLKWNIDSTDLYYQGKTNNKLPVSLTVKYELNGKEINPKDALGEAGNFKITLTLTNNESKTKVVNGKSRTLYTPFLSATELTLSNDNFSNVKVNTGKILNDGNNSLVTFISLPGLKESLDLDGLFDNKEDINMDLDLKDSIEITGETTNFEIPAIMMLVTTSSEELEEIKGSETINDLRSSLNDLKEGGEDLLSGSKKLLDGQKELASNYKTFNNGINTLADGASKLNNGISELNGKVPELVTGANALMNGAGQIKDNYALFNEGVSTLSNGATALDSGVNKLTNSVPALVDGSKQLEDGLGQVKNNYETFNTGVSSLANGASDLNDGISSLGEQAPTLIQGIKDLNNGLAKLDENREAMATGVNEYVDNSIKIQGGYDQLNKGIITAAAGAKTLSDGISSGSEGIESLVNSTETLDGFAASLNQIIEGLGDTNPELTKSLRQISGGIAQVSEGQKVGLATLGSGLGTAATSANELSEGLSKASQTSEYLNGQFETLVSNGEKLKTGATAILEGLGVAYAGSQQLANATGTLETGISKLTKGSGVLLAGANELNSNSVKINEAVGQLYTGSTQLSTGTTQLQAGTTELQAGSSQVASGAKALSDNSKKINDAVGTLYNGTTTLTQGGTALSQGVGELANGGNSLVEGTNSLKTASSQILEGTEKLENGTSELYDGVSKLKKEGLDQISDKGNTALDSIDGFVEVKDELVQMSKDYGVYSGLSEDMDGVVKFVMRSNSVESDKKVLKVETDKVSNKEEEVSKVDTQKDTIFTRIKKLFS